MYIAHVVVVVVARLIPPYHIWSIHWPTCYLPYHTRNHVCVRKWHQMGHRRQNIDSVADLRHSLQSVCKLGIQVLAESARFARRLNDMNIAAASYCSFESAKTIKWTLDICGKPSALTMNSNDSTYAIPFETKIRYTQYTIRTGISVHAEFMVCKRDSNELWNDIQPHTPSSAIYAYRLC